MDDKTAPDRSEEGDPQREGRISIGFRVAPSTKAQIDQAALESGRSQAQELELRVLSSFQKEELLPGVLRLLCGTALAEIALELIDVLRWTANNRFRLLEVSGRDPLTDPWWYGQLLEAVRAVMQYHKPAGEAAEPPSIPLAYPRGLVTPEQREAVRRIFNDGLATERNIGETIAKRRRQITVIEKTVPGVVVSDNKAEQPTPKKKQPRRG